MTNVSTQVNGQDDLGPVTTSTVVTNQGTLEPTSASASMHQVEGVATQVDGHELDPDEENWEASFEAAVEHLTSPAPSPPQPVPAPRRNPPDAPAKKRTGAQILGVSIKARKVKTLRYI